MLAMVGLVLAISVAFIPVSRAENSGQPPEDFYNQQIVHVYVNDEDGNDETCLSLGSRTPCRSLEHIARAVTNMSSVSQLEIIVHGELELKSMVTFSHLSGVILTGNQSQNNVTCSDSSAGLVFTSVQNVSIENLMFSQCGAFQRYIAVSTAEPERPIRAAIHILSPINIALTSVTLTSNSGSGLSITDVQGGVVKIFNSTFDHNMIKYQSEYEGGSGIWLWQYQKNSNEIFIENCLFLNNRARTIDNYEFITNFGSVIPGSGRGGGIEILLTDSAAFNKITVSSCNFTGNVAFIGGGLGVYMRDNAQVNSILVENCTFNRNGCHEGAQSGSGGGALFGFSFLRKNQSLSDNLIWVEDTVFEENCAEIGGGTTFVSSRSERADFNNSITFSDCEWIANNARLGAAVDINPHNLDRLTRGFFPTPLFIDCEFINNSVTFRTRDLHHTFGTGTFFSSLFDVTFQSSVRFLSNSGSAFIIVNGIVDFSSCNATFMDNTGLQGGAIVLIGISSVQVGPHGIYTFIRNRATDRGGAIYVHMTDEHDFSISRSCFIQYSENLRQALLLPVSNWTCSFIFRDNFAQRYGNSIFSTTLVPCHLRLYESSRIQSLSNFTSSGIFVFENVEKIVEYQFATEGARFNITGSLPFWFIPGQEHMLEVDLLDDLGQKIDTPIRASIVDEDSSILKVDDAFSCVTGNAIRLLGEEGERGDLLLQSTASRRNSILLNVSLSQCPVGFLHTKKNGVCVCDTQSYVGLRNCNYSNFQVHIEVGFWAGYVQNVDSTPELVSSLCPIGFCSYSESRIARDSTIQLPSTAFPEVLDEFICGHARTGILCGKCTDGHTVNYNSPYYSCEEATLCELGWLFYILSELVPVTILFVVVLTFNISFTSGAINGFILFSQLLDTLFIDGSGVIEAPEAVRDISYGYHIIYGFFSLNFFSINPLSFCLWKDATVLDILAFKYVTIAYAFILILSVIMFMKYCARRMLGRYFKLSILKNSVIHGLSAFVVICYAQCIKVSLNILLPQTILGRGGIALHPKRVFLNGDIAHFSKEHLPYAIPAVLVLVIVGVIPPLLLLAYPLVNKLLAFWGIGESHIVISTSKKIPISKLKPFLDSFQGCFRDNFRFFAGLYLIYRWIGPLAYTRTSNTDYTAHGSRCGTSLHNLVAQHHRCTPPGKSGYYKRSHIPVLLLQQVQGRLPDWHR